MKDKDDSKLYLALLAILLAVPNAVFSVFVITQIWGWFVTPLGAPGLGLAHAFGLRLLVHLATWQGPNAKKDDREDRSPMSIVLVSAFYHAVVWGFGALAHWMMQ